MRVADRLRMVMRDKKITTDQVARKTNKAMSTIYNTFSNDRKKDIGGMTFANAEMLAEAMGCEIIIRDKETGKEY